MAPFEDVTNMRDEVVLFYNDRKTELLSCGGVERWGRGGLFLVTSTHLSSDSPVAFLVGIRRRGRGA
jgi:hypothetical protein